MQVSSLKQIDYNKIDIEKTVRIGGVQVVDAAKFYWSNDAHQVIAKDMNNFAMLCFTFRAPIAIRVISNSEVSLFGLGMQNIIVRYSARREKK